MTERSNNPVTSASPRPVGLRVAMVVSVLVLVLAGLVFSNSLAGRHVIDDGGPPTANGRLGVRFAVASLVLTGIFALIDRR